MKSYRNNLQLDLTPCIITKPYNKKTKNISKCIQQITMLMTKFEEQLKEQGDEY